MSRLLAAVIVMAFAAPTIACINDNESPTHEREFRSQYGGLAGLPTMDEFAYQYPIRFKLLTGGGAILLVGAVAVVSKRARTRA